MNVSACFCACTCIYIDKQLLVKRGRIWEIPETFFATLIYYLHKLFLLENLRPLNSVLFCWKSNFNHLKYFCVSH